jgi:pilus assembly protein CpaE
MLTFILAFSERETGGYLEEKIKAAPVTLLAVCQRMEDLPTLIERHRPNGVLMDISADPEALLPPVERMIEKSPGLTVFLACQKSKCHQGLLLAAMRLGVREFFPIPFEEDLKLAVRRLSEKVLSSPEPARAAGGRLVCLLSSKGGSGSTLLSTNLAVSLSQKRGKSTALVDLNLQLGDVSLFLNLKPRATIIDLAKNIERLDGVLLRELMTKHSTGVEVLAAPKRLEEAGLLSQAHLQKAYSLLKVMFDWVVVDLSIALDEPMLTTLHYADEILLVTLLNLPSLRNAKRYLEILGRLGYPHDRVKILVNRYQRGGDGTVGIKEAEAALGQPIVHSVPNDYRIVAAAINQGLPLMTLEPHHPIVKSLDDLGRLLDEPPAGRKASLPIPGAKEEKSKKSFLGRLFSVPAEVK